VGVLDYSGQLKSQNQSEKQPSCWAKPIVGSRNQKKKKKKGQLLLLLLYVARKKQTLSLCTCKQVGQSGLDRPSPAEPSRAAKALPALMWSPSTTLVALVVPWATAFFIHGSASYFSCPPKQLVYCPLRPTNIFLLFLTEQSRTQHNTTDFDKRSGWICKPTCISASKQSEWASESELTFLLSSRGDVFLCMLFVDRPTNLPYYTLQFYLTA
jgi:hypothetical protein